MKAISQYVSGEWFRTPPGVVRKVVCEDSGKLAVQGSCPRPVEGVFLEKQAPTTICPLHPPPSVFEKFWKGLKNVAPPS